MDSGSEASLASSEQLSRFWDTENRDEVCIETWNWIGWETSEPSLVRAALFGLSLVRRTISQAFMLQRLIVKINMNLPYVTQQAVKSMTVVSPGFFGETKDGKKEKGTGRRWPSREFHTKGFERSTPPKKSRYLSHAREIKMNVSPVDIRDYGRVKSI